MLADCMRASKQYFAESTDSMAAGSPALARQRTAEAAQTRPTELYLEEWFPKYPLGCQRRVHERFKHRAVSHLHVYYF